MCTRQTDANYRKGFKMKIPKLVVMLVVAMLAGLSLIFFVM
jgi:hypothetical protein